MGKRLQSLVPRLCFLCSADNNHFICEDCHADLPNITHCCPQCSLPLLHTALCPECQITHPSFSTSVSAFAYTGAVPFLIKQFKQHRHFGCGHFLSCALADKIKQQHEDSLPRLITSVPLHWTRAFTRQFNQAEVVARQLAMALSIPYVSVLKKPRLTPSQKQLTRKQRLRNLLKSYALTTEVAGRHIALVDDVMTTGATAESISKRLISAGAKRVDIWTLARTPK